MPCLMSSTFVPSLRCRASVKVGVLLWKNNEDALSLADFCFTAKKCPGKHKEWQRIERRILSKTKSLSLPTELHQKLACFIRIIGMEMMKWKENQLSKITTSREFLRACISNICWTSYGCVDVRRTSRAIVHDQSVDVCSRYEVACINCVESDVLLMWEALPSTHKDLYTQNSNRRINAFDTKTLIRYWTCFARGVWNEEVKTYENDFEFIMAVELGNKVAAEYFWKKMRDEVRYIYFSLAMKTLVSIASEDISAHKCCFGNISYCSDIACYLLSRNPPQIPAGRVDNRLALTPLLCLLDWPHQSSFSELFTRSVSECITSAEFHFVSKYLIHKIHCGYRDCEYSGVLRELWTNCPLAHRLSFVRQNTLQFFLKPLLRDHETLSFVLRHVAPWRRLKMIFTNTGRKMCVSLVKHKNWRSLAVLLRVSLMKRENVLLFRDQIFSRRVTRASLEAAAKKDIVADMYRFLSRLAHNMGQHGINLSH